MTYNHNAIYKAYPNVVTIDDGIGAFDFDGNQVQLDQAKVDAALVIVAKEQALETARRKRAAAYAAESDPIFFKAQRGEATMDDWRVMVASIQLSIPYPDEKVTP